MSVVNNGSAEVVTTQAENVPVVPKNPNDYAKWRLTGKMPDPPNGSAAEGVTSENSELDSNGSDENGALASEARNENKAKGKVRSTAASRLEEVLGILKDEDLTPAKLKALKAEVIELRAKIQSVSQNPVQTAETTEKPPEKPKRPKYIDFDGDEQAYEQAMEAYEENLTSYKAQEAIEKFKKSELDKAERAELTAKMNEARSRYGDEAQGIITNTVALIVDDARIPIGVKTIINQSPVLTDLMYVMGQDPTDLDDFIKDARSDPGRAVRRVVLLERLVQEELKKRSNATTIVTEGAENPKPKSKMQIEPPEEVGGNKGSLPDPVQSAANSNDFARFRREANTRDLARMRGN
jgi:hypothetical protein